MVRSQRSPRARRRLAAAVVLALLAAGCGGHSNVQFASASGSPPTGVASGGSVSVHGDSTFAVLFAIAVLTGVSYRGDQVVPTLERAPEMDPARRVAEQDCTRPIEDRSANLKCR